MIPVIPKQRVDGKFHRMKRGHWCCLVETDRAGDEIRLSEASAFTLRYT